MEATRMSTDVSPAGVPDWGKILSLLGRAGLPTEDLAPERAPDFLVIRSPDGIAGAVTVERHGSAGLLRSLVIDEARRGAGLGAVLLAAIERKAVAEGIDHLWLLTIDAEGFFGRHGYTKRERSEAPEGIRQTAEFSTLCPDSAQLMSRSLPPD